MPGTPLLVTLSPDPAPSSHLRTPASSPFVQNGWHDNWDWDNCGNNRSMCANRFNGYYGGRFQCNRDHDGNWGWGQNGGSYNGGDS